MVVDSKIMVDAINALCILSERCQSIAKFSESRMEWYGRSEKFADEACAIASKLNLLKGDKNGN